MTTTLSQFDLEIFAYKKGSRWGVYMHHQGQILTPLEDGGLLAAPGQHCPDKCGIAPYRTLKSLKGDYPYAKRHL